MEGARYDATTKCQPTKSKKSNQVYFKVERETEEHEKLHGCVLLTVLQRMMDDGWYCMDICGLHVGGGYRTEVEPPRKIW